MAYKIDFGGWGSVFAVPTSVVDKGLKLAGEAQLKVLLYLLRHSGDSLTDELVAEALSIHPEDVADAIEYWAGKGLLVCTGGTVTMPAAVSTDNTAEYAPQTVKADTAGKQEKPRPVSRPTKPEPRYVAKRLKADQNLVFLMDEAQRILGKVLSNADTSTLLMLHDTDGLPIEIILMLLEHCVQIDKGNMRYIERVGIQWGSEGITTINLAEEKIKQYSEATSAWGVICAVFGIHLSGTPSKKQLEYSDLWVNEWKFSEQMLRMAYERCVDSKGNINLSYINGILKRWNEKGLKKPEDVIRADSATVKKGKTSEKSQGNSPSYNIDEYENNSIFDD